MEAVEVHRAVLVDDPGALVLLGLPDPEHGALAVGEHRHPARVAGVEGLGQDRPARGPHPLGGVVGAVDPHVRPPRGRGIGPVPVR